MLERAQEAGYAAVQPVVGACERLGVSPNAVTSVSVVVAFVAGGFLYVATPVAYAVAAALVVVNGVLDVLDGELARRTGTADARGDMLDHTADRYADVAVVAGAAAGVGAWTVGFFAVAGVVLVAEVGAAAQARGNDRVYGGILTRADISTAIVLGSVAGAAGADVAGYEPFVVILVVVAVTGHATVVQRAAMVARDDS